MQPVPVESEEGAIHDEEPLQTHSKDVFHAEQQPTADIDDSSYSAVDDDDDDPDIVGWFDGLGQSSTGNYHPFPSKIFALLFFLVNSPHPMGNVPWRCLAH